jgi:hypothetical protein
MYTAAFAPSGWYHENRLACGLPRAVREGIAVIEFDLNGRKARFDERTVQRLRAIARAEAGSSTTLNDLAVILDRALTGGHPVTLQRGEARAFEALLERL